MRKANNFLLLFIAGTSVFILLFFGITISPMQAKGKPKPVSPPLTLAASNIVTYEPANSRIQVWGNDGGGYSNIWTAEQVKYPSIAIGDIDSDGKEEIAGLGICKKVYGKGKNREEYYKIFINVYKVGIPGIWMTTYYDSDYNNIIEEKQLWLTSEIVLNDIDGDGLNEIILVTKTYLAVYKYKYNSGEEKLEKIASHQLSSDIPSVDLADGQYSLRLQSVTVGDIDGDSQKEIIAGGHLISIHNEGYIFIYNLDSNLVKKQIIPVAYNFGDNSLRAGDFDGDGQMEFCTTAFKNDYDTYEPYILLWDYNNNAGSYELNNYKLTDDTSYPWNHLDVGNLDDDPSHDEIALVIGNSKQLWIYNWKNMSGLSTLPDPLTIYLNPSTIINKIAIGDSNSDNNNEINIAGAIRKKTGGSKWKFYLAVYNVVYNVVNGPLLEQEDLDGTEVSYIVVDNKI